MRSMSGKPSSGTSSWAQTGDQAAPDEEMEAGGPACATARAGVDPRRPAPTSRTAFARCVWRTGWRWSARESGRLPDVRYEMTRHDGAVLLEQLAGWPDCVWNPMAWKPWPADAS